MNRPRTIAKIRKQAKGFMATEPESNQDSNHGQTSDGFDSNFIKDLFQACDRATPAFTAVSVALSAGVTDAAVGKARKAIKQVLPEDVIFRDKKFTELGKVLIEQYFQRPEFISGAAWIHKLQKVVGALPTASVDSPADPKGFWSSVTQDKKVETSALALRANSMLTQIRELNNYDDIGDDDAFEAELALREQLAYERELALQLAAVRGRAQARQDVRRG